MKRILFLLTLMSGLMSCVNNSESAAQAKNSVKNHVEVIYFHGKQRCATCVAIERHAKEVVDAMFANEMKDGKVIFKIVDISTPEGEALADKYEVTWSSLFVNAWKEGKETRNNMTEFAFGNARKNPDAFKKGLSAQIRQALK